MRIQVTFRDDIHAEAKKAAAESGVTLSKIVEDSLRESLALRALNDGTNQIGKAAERSPRGNKP